MYSLFISRIQMGVLYFTWQPTFPVLPPNPKEHFLGGGKELTAQHLSKAAQRYAGRQTNRTGTFWRTLLDREGTTNLSIQTKAGPTRVGSGSRFCRSNHLPHQDLVSILSFHVGSQFASDWVSCLFSAFLISVP